MAFSVGAIVANIYYIQPLLSTIATAFRISVPQVGIVAMLTQFGAALGMLFFVPLGDTKERRRLIVSLLLAESLCLALMASAQNFVWLALASFGIGGMARDLLAGFGADAVACGVDPHRFAGEQAGTQTLVAEFDAFDGGADPE